MSIVRKWAFLVALTVLVPCCVSCYPAYVDNTRFRKETVQAIQCNGLFITAYLFKGNGDDILIQIEVISAEERALDLEIRSAAISFPDGSRSECAGMPRSIRSHRLPIDSNSIDEAGRFILIYETIGTFQKQVNDGEELILEIECRVDDTLGPYTLTQGFKVARVSKWTVLFGPPTI